MAKFKVTYADDTSEELDFEGTAEELFEQQFSHCSEEVREHCSVVEATSIDDAPTAGEATPTAKKTKAK